MYAEKINLICAAAILAIDNRFRTPSLELKCLGSNFGGGKQEFQSLGTQHSRRVRETKAAYHVTSRANENACFDS